MPGEVIDRPNPAPAPSQVPDQVLSLKVELEKQKLPEDAAAGLKEFRRAACYIAAAMIFLKDNVLLEKDLSFEDVKPRLLGTYDFHVRTSGKSVYLLAAIANLQTFGC